MKKLIPTVFCLMLLVGILAFAAVPAQAYSEGDWTYSLQNESATVTGYTGPGGTVTVPKTLGGYPVTGIGADAFSGCVSLTKLTLQEGITSIGRNAFLECENLKDITFPASLKMVGEDAFLWAFVQHVEISDLAAWCAVDFADEISNPAVYSHGLWLNGELITKLTIPDGVESIGNYAFAYCDTIRTISIPNGVKRIGDNAFYGSGIRALTIPASVTSIGDSTFECCGLEELSLSSGLQFIGSGAFRSCYHLKHVSIPAGVTSIGEEAFAGCDDLISAGPVGSGCSVEYGWTDAIPAMAFYHCPIRVAVIPSSISKIGNNAFVARGMIGMNLYYCGTQAQWDKIDGAPNDFPVECGYRLGDPILLASDEVIDGGVYYTLDHTGTLTVSGSGKIPNDFLSSAFYSSYLMTGSEIDTVLIKSGVIGIGSHAFTGCGMRTLTIPGSVMNIGSEAFSMCDSLTDLTISEGVEILSAAAFIQCSSLKSVSLPRSLTMINRDVFTACDALTDVYYAGTQAEWAWISIAPENGPLFKATIHYGTVPESVSIQPTNPSVGSLWVLSAMRIGEELTIRTRSDVDAPVFLAAYNANGRMVRIMSAQCVNGTYTLPVGADAGKYQWKLLFVGATGFKPLTCVYSVTFPA